MRRFTDVLSHASLGHWDLQKVLVQRCQDALASNVKLTQKLQKYVGIPSDRCLLAHGMRRAWMYVAHSHQEDTHIYIYVYLYIKKDQRKMGMCLCSLYRGSWLYLWSLHISLYRG